jgi:hypothetical protein
MSLVTFIIPVRHQDNARDWAGLKAKLTQTVASIANQTNGDWRGIIVANEGADLPDLPERFSAVRVTFPANDMHELGKAGMDAFYEAFRLDKGRRVLSGMLAARDSQFFMIVDDDDFVSARIVQHVAEHRDANGWTIDRGYVWDDGGKLLLKNDNFNHLCGTSLIVRADRYRLPESFSDASAEWIKSMLGSHRQISALLAEEGAALTTLPFRGAVYRVGNAGSHSRTPGILSKYFFSIEAARHPLGLVRNLTKLGLVGETARREFFGG